MLLARRSLLTLASAAAVTPLIHRLAKAGPMVGFSADLDGVNQPNCLNLQYTPVIMRGYDFNDAGYDFTNNWWMPPASAGTVEMAFNVWIDAHARLPSNIPGDGYAQCAKIHYSDDKGVTWNQLKASPGYNPAGYTYTGGSGAAGILAKATGTRAFRLYMYTTSDTGGNDCVIDGNTAHTWFDGFWTI